MTAAHIPATAAALPALAALPRLTSGRGFSSACRSVPNMTEPAWGSASARKGNLPQQLARQRMKQPTAQSGGASRNGSDSPDTHDSRRDGTICKPRTPRMPKSCLGAAARHSGDGVLSHTPARATAQTSPFSSPVGARPRSARPRLPGLDLFTLPGALPRAVPVGGRALRTANAGRPVSLAGDTMTESSIRCWAYDQGNGELCVTCSPTVAEGWRNFFRDRGGEHGAIVEMRLTVTCDGGRALLAAADAAEGGARG